MKLKKPPQRTSDVIFSIDEQNRVAAFMQLLIQIDRRIKCCTSREPKAKKEPKIKLHTQGPRNSWPLFLSYGYFEHSVHKYIIATTKRHLFDTIVLLVIYCDSIILWQ